MRREKLCGEKNEKEGKSTSENSLGKLNEWLKKQLNYCKKNLYSRSDVLKWLYTESELPICWQKEFRLISFQMAEISKEQKKTFLGHF